MKEEPRNYNNPGRCPKCNTKLAFQAQAGAMPPNMGCYACGYHDWDMKGFKFNPDMLPRR